MPEKNLYQNFSVFLESESVKGITYKSRFQRKLSRYRISTTISNWEKHISTKDERKRIHFVVTNNKTLPNVKQVINKNWHLLQINPNLGTAFDLKPMLAYKNKNKNFGDLTGSKNILDGKVVHRNNSKKQLYCRPCLNRRDNICCQQISKTNIFASYRTGEMFKIFHQLNCKHAHLIYVLQCRLCQLCW